jgi:hypothetical protein
MVTEEEQEVSPLSAQVKKLLLVCDQKITWADYARDIG